ncbi:hypothetical protein JCM3765_004442 [Sporobolomyces pararoseus]
MSSPASLPSLPSVSKISTYVTRILGQNPGKFTLQGTNTYLIHHPTSPSLILLDTAQSFPSYLPHLRSSILAHSIQPCYLTDIILSHYHLDHVDGLRSVLEELGNIGAVGEKGVRIWKFRCDGDEEEGKDLEIEEKLEGIEEGLIDTTELGEEARLVKDGGKIRALQDGQKFSITGLQDGQEEDGVELEVVHTPGHTTDSISILLRTTSAPPTSELSKPLALFSFDTVLGHGTAVFSSLSTYLSSLTSLISLLSSSSSSFPSPVPPATPSIPIYPGHGSVIEDGLSKLREYRQHRLDREGQVVDALKSRKAEKVTASSLTESIYGSTIPESLKPAATRGLLLHLEKLVLDGQVARHNRGEEGGQEELKVDWDKLGVSAKDMPKGWDDKWSWIGPN